MTMNEQRVPLGSTRGAVRPGPVMVRDAARAVGGSAMGRRHHVADAKIMSRVGDHPQPQQASNGGAPLSSGERSEEGAGGDASSGGPRRKQVPHRKQAHIHLIIGPVGAGKSTFALGLAREHAAVRLTLDEWMARLFRPDRPAEGLMPWYAERAARCIDQIWALAKQLLAVQTDVILEIGLLRRSEREAFYARLDAVESAWTLYVLDAAREVRRERVEARNHAQGETFSMVVPAAIFELASDLWEPPEPDECIARDVRFIRTDEPASVTSPVANVPS